MEQKTVFSHADKKLLITAALMTALTSMAASYANSIVLPVKLSAFDAMDYYALLSALCGMGAMIALPMVGALCTRLGTKAVTMAGMIAHFLARAYLIFAPGLVWFALGWALMGFANGLYMSAPYTLIAQVVSPEQRPKYYGYVSVASAVGALVGPAMTGAVADTLSVDAAMLVFGVFAVYPLVILGWKYPNQTAAVKANFDYAGLVWLSLCVCSTIVWLSMVGKAFQLVSLLGLGIPLLAVGCLVMLIKTERKVDNSSVPIGMFHKRRFTVTFFVQLLMVAYSMSVTVYTVVYVQQVMGRSALISSTVTMPQTIVQGILGFFVGSVVGKNFQKRFRPAALLAVSLYMVALMILTTLRPDSGMVVVYVATALGGISQAITQSVFSPFFQTELKPEEIPAAQGMFQFSGTGGASIFGAICGAVLNLGANYNQIFALSVCVVGVALIIAFFGFRFPKQSLSQ